MAPQTHFNLEKLLDLKALSSNKFISTNLLNAPPQSKGIFGGTIVAQSLLACLQTCPEQFVPNSVHTYFLIGGDPREKITYTVETLRNGRNFLQRQVRAWQYEKLISTSIISFVNHTLEDNGIKTYKKVDMPDLSHFKSAGEVMRKTVEGREFLPHMFSGDNQKYYDRFDKGPISYMFQEDLIDPSLGNNPAPEYIDIMCRVNTEIAYPGRSLPEQRCVDDMDFDSYLGLEGVKKVTAADPRFQYIAMAYYSDGYFLLLTPRFSNLPIYSHKFQVSLDHSIHFHSLPDCNQWMLFRTRNPKSADNRHMVLGELYDQSGRIACNLSQEGLVTFREETLKAKL